VRNQRMRNFEYCKPVNAKAAPTGPDWIPAVNVQNQTIRAE